MATTAVEKVSAGKSELEHGVTFRFASLNAQYLPPSIRRSVIDLASPDVAWVESPQDKHAQIISVNNVDPATQLPQPVVEIPPSIPYDALLEFRRSLRSMILGFTPPHIPGVDPDRYVAMDCEMVGVGPVLAPRRRNQRVAVTRSSLARVSLVDFNGCVLLDTFVRQQEPVTDYRTVVSGVRPEDVHGPYARSFSAVRADVARILKNRILVGHAVHNDLKSLRYSHPPETTKDTQLCPQIWKLYCNPCIGLRTLCIAEFGLDVQHGEHCSITDARAAMAIYRLYRSGWGPDF